MTEPIEYQSPALVSFLQHLSKRLSLAVILIGVITVLGWIFDIQVFKAVLP